MAQPKNFGFSDEEQMVRDSARKFLKDHAGIETLRKLVARDHREAYESDVQPAPYDERVWQRIVDLGWPALAVPESAGGVGMKMIAVASLAEEIGRAALPSPLTATLIATTVLRAAAEHGSATSATWLGKIAAGEPATLGGTNADGSWDAGATDVRVTATADGARLTGTAHFVQDARKVRTLVVAAAGDAGVGLYALPIDAPGVSILPDRIVDLTRDQARVELRDVVVPADGIITPDGGTAAIAAALPAILTIVAADLTGAAEWQMQTTAEYARVRTQFDRPIGFFQAVKHPIVEMMIAVDRARSLTYAAACAIDTDPDDALRLARMAKAAGSDAAAFCSDRSVQLHGGIGFTWECDVHIYFKRQKHNEILYGDGPFQRARVAELLGE